MIVFGRTASSRVLRHFWKDRKKAVFLCFHCVNWRIENTASDGLIENFRIFCCGSISPVLAVRPRRRGSLVEKESAQKLVD